MQSQPGMSAMSGRGSLRGVGRGGRGGVPVSGRGFMRGGAARGGGMMHPGPSFESPFPF